MKGLYWLHPLNVKEERKDHTNVKDMSRKTESKQLSQDMHARK